VNGFEDSGGLSGAAVVCPIWADWPKTEGGLEAASVVDDAGGRLRNENGLFPACACGVGWLSAANGLEAAEAVGCEAWNPGNDGAAACAGVPPSAPVAGIALAKGEVVVAAANGDGVVADGIDGLTGGTTVGLPIDDKSFDAAAWATNIPSGLSSALGISAPSGFSAASSNTVL
jgi:hypothetical protein